MKHLILVSIIAGIFNFFIPQSCIASDQVNSEKRSVFIKEFSDGSPGERTVCFLPDTQSIVSCLIFCHAFEEQYQSYYELIMHCVSNGAAVIYVPARKIPFEKSKLSNYDFSVTPIVNAVSYFTKIDTSRIMLIGHGFGAGAGPTLMRKLREKGWGSNAAIMYLMSPWYLYDIDEHQMSDYPDSVSLVVEVFKDEHYNDPMIAADIFSLIGIPNDRKAFLIVPSDKLGKKKSIADYLLPLGDQSFTGKCDFLDTIAVFNIIDSLFRYGFDTTRHTNSTMLKSVRTFNLPVDKRFSEDSIQPIMVTDSPFVYIPNGAYLNPWQSVRNPRIDVSRFRKFRKLTMRYEINKVNQVSRYLVKKIASDLEHDTSAVLTNPIKSGFGANGRYKTLEKACGNPKYPKEKVYIFLPELIKTPVPVIIFLHGYNGGDPLYYSHLITHMVSNGNGVIFPTYSPFPVVNDPEAIKEKYDILYTGICEAFHLNRSAFDSTRVGIFGHSFGGGAVSWISSKMFTEKKWGAKAAFLFISAPWYVCGMSDSSFRKLPSHLKALIVTYSDDAYNDHQIAVELFNRLNVPLTEKRYFTFQSDTLDSTAMVANHFVPYGVENINGVEDNFDYFGIFKLFDAISSYCFQGNMDGKECALGSNSGIQNWMGVWHDGTPVKPSLSTTNPKVVRLENSFVFVWENPLNPQYKVVIPIRAK